MIHILITLVTLCFMMVSNAFAHHLWVEKEGERFAIKWGHPPKADPYDPHRLKEIKVFDKKAEVVKFERINEKDRVYLSIDAGVSMVLIPSFEGGYVVGTPEGKRRMTKREAQKAGLQVVDSFYSTQFAKSLFGYGDAIMKPLGMRFEIVPLKNPFELKADEPLPIMVLFDGKPLEGAKIEIGRHKETGRTNANGFAEVRPSGESIEVIIAKHRIALKDNPDTDYLSFTTVLTWTRDGK